MPQKPAWFDPQVNLGHVLIIVSLLASVLLAYGDLRSTDERLALRLDTLERDDDRRRQFETEMRLTLSKILQDLAVLKDAREREAS